MAASIAHEAGPHENPLILAGIAAELVLILSIVYTGVGNAVLGTAPLAAEVWLFVLPSPP